MNVATAKSTTTVMGYLTTGVECTIIADPDIAKKYKLEGGTYHLFYRPNGTKIIFIVADGAGKAYTSKAGNLGVSLVGLVTNEVFANGCLSYDALDVRDINIISKKDRKSLTH